MRVPLAQIIEACELVSRACKEFRESDAVMFGIALEMSHRAARALNGNLDDPECSSFDVLAHEHAADLAPACGPQLTPQPRDHCRCQENLHSRISEIVEG